MSAPKPYSETLLDEEALLADRKKCKRYDQCGVGEKAVYLPSKMRPRKYYIPFTALTHIYKRVAVSPGSGKAFLTPILYIVFRYDNGKEKQVYFKYLKDADKMFDDLEQNHPEIILLSPQGVEDKKEKEAQEEKIRSRELSPEELSLVRRLEQAKYHLEKRPSLYEKMVVCAKVKRTVDLIKPAYQWLAGAIILVGAILLIAGAYLFKKGGNSMLALVLVMLGVASMFVMANSKILPTPGRTRRSTQKKYDEAVEAMERHIGAFPNFPLPAYYAHPYALDRIIRSIRSEKASDFNSAMEILKNDLKAADNTVALSGREYEEVVMLKPLFLVKDYQ